MKFTDFIKLQNCLLIHDDLNKNNPYGLQNSFTLAKDLHSYATRGALNNKVILPKIKKVTYGEYSINYQAAKVWNELVSKFANERLQDQSRLTCKKFLQSYFLEQYNN